jgi:hypothetical protein
MDNENGMLYRSVAKKLVIACQESLDEVSMVDDCSNIWYGCSLVRCPCTST